MIEKIDYWAYKASKFHVKQNELICNDDILKIGLTTANHLLTPKNCVFDANNINSNNENSKQKQKQNWNVLRLLWAMSIAFCLSVHVISRKVTVSIDRIGQFTEIFSISQTNFRRESHFYCYRCYYFSVLINVYYENR